MKDSSRPERLGRYELLAELGRGSMARVFLSIDPNIDRRVALKVFDPAPDLAAEVREELRDRFLLEARTVGKLHHPGIVTVFDADVDPSTGLSYIAMELIEGQPLADLLKNRGPLPVGTAVSIASQIATALDYAHREGFVHRDVKPANILIGVNGEAKLVDFGIAKSDDFSMTRTGTLIGSPYYMSPEQVRGETVDSRSDLFSLGASLYHCLTGAVPFDGDSIANIVFKIVTIDPRPPSSPREPIPAGLRGVLEKVLAKNPDDRYQTGRELAEALKPYGTEGGSAAVERTLPRARGREENHDALRTSRSSEPGPKGKTPRRLLWLVGLALALGVALASTFMLRDGRGRGQSESVAAQSSLPPPAAEPSPTLPESQQTASRPPETGSVSSGGEPVGSLPGGETDERGGSAPGTDRGEPREEARAAVGSGQARLRVVHKNRLKRATMSIWLDGTLVSERRLAVGGNPIKRIRGDDVSFVLDVPEGRRTIRVRIRGDEGRVDVSSSIDGSFVADERRVLRISLGYLGRDFGLEWLR